MTPLLLVLALVGASPRPADSALWDAAFSLNDPTEAPRAGALLTKAGPAGIDVLLKLARAGGDSIAFNAAAIDLRCPMGLVSNDNMSQNMRAARSPQPAQLAARFLSTRMKEDPRLRERLLTSRSSFERRLALAHVSPDPQALLEALTRLENEKDAQVLSLASRALQCAVFHVSAADRENLRGAQAKVDQKLQDLLPQTRCDSAEGITGELREGLRQRLWQFAGWNFSGQEYALSVDTGRGVLLRLTPPCALALYDVLAKSDVYLHELVMPLLTAEDVTREHRQAAAERIGRDLEHYSEFIRNRLAAELVNAGYPGSRTIVVREDGSADEVELEAAARRKQPGALEAIEAHVFCRDRFGAPTLALLGFVGTAQAAETASQYATRCPHLRGPATAALLRLKDPRALQWLGSALEQPFADQFLRRAALEAYTPALGEKLRALEAAEPDSKAAHGAARLLTQLEQAGLLTP